MKTIQNPERSEARHIINTEGRKHTLILYFTKADGSKRRMVARYYGSASRTPATMTLWDAEKGAVRTVNLDRVHTLKVAGTAQRSFEELQAEMDALFY